MKSITDSTLRNSLPAIMDSINQEHSPIMVTRENGKPVVIMSLDDFKSYEATAHLMSSRNNVERINRSIAQLEAGKGIERGLIEE